MNVEREYKDVSYIQCIKIGRDIGIQCSLTRENIHKTTEFQSFDELILRKASIKHQFFRGSFINRVYLNIEGNFDCKIVRGVKGSVGLEESYRNLECTGKKLLSDFFKEFSPIK